MSTELGLRLAKDREYVAPSSRQVLAIIGLQGAGTGAGGAPLERFRGLELALAVDCSGSMVETETGTGGGPTKLDKAIEAMWATVSQMSTGDLISIVGFDSRASIILDRLSGRDRSRFRNSSERVGLEQQLRAFGGRTNVLEALKLSCSVLSQGNGTIQRIILLSDGQANEPWSLGSLEAIVDATVKYARELGRRGVVLDVLGYGLGADLRFDFLSALADPTGGQREHVQASPDAVLKRILSRARKVYASNVELAVRFPGYVQVGDVYRFEPQIMYMRSAPVTATERTIILRAGQLELGEAYTWMFEMTAPSVPVGQITLAQVGITYRLPDGSQHRDQGTLTVQMTDDVGLADQRDGNYMIWYEQAKLNKLEKALGDAQAQRNAPQMTTLLTQMIQRCRELGLDDEASRYQRIFDSFQKDQDFVRAAMAAASTSTSSKSRPSDYIREGGVAGPPPPPPPKLHRPRRPRRRR